MCVTTYYVCVIGFSQAVPNHTTEIYNCVEIISYTMKLLLLLQLQKNVKLLDLTQERPAEIPFLKQKAAEIVLEFKKLKEVYYNYMFLLYIYMWN